MRHEKRTEERDLFWRSGYRGLTPEQKRSVYGLSESGMVWKSSLQRDLRYNVVVSNEAHRMVDFTHHHLRETSQSFRY